MKSKPFFLIMAGLLILSAFSATGCSKSMDYLGKRPTTGPFFKEDKTPMVRLNYDAANRIAGQLFDRLPAGSPITVSVFRMRGSNVQSDFASIATEQVASRLAQHGFAIVADNSKFPTTPVDKGRPVPVKCILAGAYTVGSESIALTAAVSDLDDGEILGSYDWRVPLNSETRALLPLEEPAYIEPMVNTSGPMNSNETGYKPDYQPDHDNSAPGFEQNIIE